MTDDVIVQASADVDESADLGPRTRVWHLAQIRENARIGAWAPVAAGAVVTKDVLAHALVVGVPARRVGWVGRTGRPLTHDGDAWVCSDTAERFVQEGEILRMIP